MQRLDGLGILHQLITPLILPHTMLDLLVLALLQVATLTGTPTNNIGGSGWDHDYTGSTTPPTTQTIGGSGWDHDYTGSTTTPEPGARIGGSGWDHDYTGSTTTPEPGTNIGGSGWDHD